VVAAAVVPAVALVVAAAVVRVTAAGDDVDVTGTVDGGAAAPTPALRQPVASRVRPAASAAVRKTIRISEFMRFPRLCETEHLMDALEVPRVAVPSGVFPA
jgi:hypothetical protein